MAEKKEFKAESKRLLDLMIHSIYTHKEIFLRELISNASDALDKYYLYALKHSQTPGDLKIRIELDEENRTLSLEDNGIGMSREELEENLGTIARSGSLAFKEELKKQEENPSDVDIIGQFGVGFYSAFMVSDDVCVYSRAAGSDQGWKWESDGVNGYTLEECDKAERGTKIVLKLKADDDLDSYSQYLNSYTIQDLIKKYSDYIRYPITMEVETEKLVEGSPEDKPEFESVKEEKTLNSMVPLWKRPKSEITEEEFNQFYKEHFMEYTNPLKTIFFNVEGNVSFTALLYIPSAVPAGFYSKEYKPGLQLYSRGVFIENDCESLLPDYLRFVKGLVDSQDLSLNISREMLQHDHQLRVIRNRIEKKVLSELANMLKNDRESYESFWKNFGLDIKFGIYNDMSGTNKEKLENLLLFTSTKDLKPVTLAEYVESMPEDQKDIYYVSGQNLDVMGKLPIVTRLKEKGYNVLLCTQDVDDFVLQSLGSYEDHPFRNASQGDLNLDSEEEKEALKTQNEENKDLLDFMKEALPEVSEVRLSNRLVEDPVMLVAGDGLSFEMEKVFEAMAAQNNEQAIPGMKATRILEINPNSPIWTLLRADYASDKDKVKEIAQVLYDQALLIEGFAIKDPIEYSRKVVSLLAEANSVKKDA